jgi:hypothetical protein
LRLAQAGITGEANQAPMAHRRPAEAADMGPARVSDADPDVELAGIRKEAVEAIEADTLARGLEAQGAGSTNSGLCSLY